MQSLPLLLHWPPHEDDAVFQRLSTAEQTWVHRVWTLLARYRARLLMMAPLEPREEEEEETLADMLREARRVIEGWQQHDAALHAWLLSTEADGASPELMDDADLYGTLMRMERHCREDAAVVARAYRRPYDDPCPRYAPADQAERTWLEERPEAWLLASNVWAYVARCRHFLSVRPRACPDKEEEGGLASVLCGASPSTLGALCTEAERLVAYEAYDDDAEAAAFIGGGGAQPSLWAHCRGRNALRRALSAVFL
jgi:hypothetical protein